MFSIRYAATLALTDSTTGPSAFTDEMVRRPAMVALRERVRVTPVSRIPSTGSPTEVKVRLKSGETLEACVNTLIPARDDELAGQWERLESKFRDLVEPILGADGANDLIGLVQRIDSLSSIRELTDKTAAKK